MFGLMTKAAHERILEHEKKVFAMIHSGKTEALENQIADLTRLLAKADQDVNALKAQLAERSAMVDRLKPHAEKELARAARAKDYEASRRKEVRAKARAKKGAAA